jgi:hypothetical protein
MVSIGQLVGLLGFAFICWISGYICGEGHALIDEEKKKETASIAEKE